jgi:Zn-dependent protease with chaperone function
MKKLKNRALTWISISGIIFGSVAYYPRQAKADIWGGDVAVLMQILVQTVQQLAALRNIIVTTQQTVSILEDINRGVKEVLRLADTAHIALPPQVYDQAKKLEEATRTAGQIYGPLSDRSPITQKVHYQSGIEGLFLSQDAFEYSTFLDKIGENVKRSAVVATQSSATRLTAETLGVVLHAISHSNRLQAKSLEISASNRLEESQKESARFESFIDTQNAVEQNLRSCSAPDLNSFGSLDLKAPPHKRGLP